MIERLVREWEKHGGLILAVDFDDTLYPYSMEDREGYAARFDLLRRCQEAGCRVIVWTASDPKRYTMIKEYVEERGVRVDGMNQNPGGLPFGNWGKIYANLYLDDRAGLHEAQTTLEEALRLHKDNQARRHEQS